jgi:hypothetical protein
MNSKDNGALLPKLFSDERPESKSASRMRFVPPPVLKTVSIMFCPARLSPSNVVAPGRPSTGHTEADPRADHSQFAGTPVPLSGAAAVAGERRPAPDGRAQVEQINVIAGIQVAGPLRIRVPTIRDYSAAARKAIPAPAGVEKKRQGLRARGYVRGLEDPILRDKDMLQPSLYSPRFMSKQKTHPRNRSGFQQVTASLFQRLNALRQSDVRRRARERVCLGSMVIHRAQDALQFTGGNYIVRVTITQ